MEIWGNLKWRRMSAVLQMLVHYRCARNAWVACTISYGYTPLSCLQRMYSSCLKDFDIIASYPYSYGCHQPCVLLKRECAGAAAACQRRDRCQRSWAQRPRCAGCRSPATQSARVRHRARQLLRPPTLPRSPWAPRSAPAPAAMFSRRRGCAPALALSAGPGLCARHAKRLHGKPAAQASSAGEH